MSSIKKFLLSLILVPSLIFISIGYYSFQKLNENYVASDSIFQVKPGEGFSSVNARLLNEDLISSARIFHRYTQFTNKMGSLKTGTYNIPKDSTMIDVLTIITEGVPILTKVTIPEGKNMYEIAKIFSEKGFGKYENFIKLFRDQNIIQEMTKNAPSVEGYLFPDTYLLSPNSSEKEITSILLREFDKQTSNIDFTHDFLSKHQIIILASIVEKETGAKWERPLIAGVYLNRLKKKMRLQADPTTIYGIWENYNGNLSRKHLLEKTDYNTYKMSGLPLGPIASPSLAAIKAVLNPDEHNYIYFVSKNDGTHVFTSTYKEHLAAVEYWQRNKRNRSGKSWRDLKQ